MEVFPIPEPLPTPRGSPQGPLAFKRAPDCLPFQASGWGLQVSLTKGRSTGGRKARGGRGRGIQTGARALSARASAAPQQKNK